MKNIDEMIDHTIGLEGGFSDHADDSGGKTMWGITEAVARRNGYTGDMRQLPRETAVKIYKREYAIKPGFVAVADIYPAVGAELFDTGVNTGPARPSIWLQEILNAMNNKGRFYADIKEDGDIGPATLEALRSYKAKRGIVGEVVLTKALNCLQGAFYLDLARRNEKYESFVYGWFKRVEL